MIYAIEVLFLAINIATAWWQARLIAQNKAILHWLWASEYAFLVAIAFYFTRHPLLAIALVLIREVAFAPALNYFRRLGFFYTSPSSTSVLDKWEGKYYIPIYIASVVALITLQFFI